MDTKQFIERLRDNSHAENSVALRQALCYYLYNENIPSTIIAHVLKRTKRYIYMSIYRTRDFLEVGDRKTKICVEEVKNHTFRIVPITADGAILSKHIGYKLLVDNKMV